MVRYLNVANTLAFCVNWVVHFSYIMHSFKIILVSAGSRCQCLELLGILIDV